MEAKLSKSPGKLGMLVFGVVLTAGILFAAVNLISDLSGVRSSSTFA